MARTSWIGLPIALSLLMLCSERSSTLGNAVFNNSDQLFEGNRCRMEDGAGEGLCKKVDDCPERMEQIRTGNYGPAGRCGFDNFDEIVCCATRKTRNLRNRAEAACQSYKKIANAIMEDSGSFHTTVVNGVRARTKEFPHMAAVGYVQDGGVKYFCGGTLISRKHVLTAAHCVDNVQGLVPVEVMLGTTDVDVPDVAGVQRVPISRIIEHPEYKTSLSYHDVAVLELRTEIEFTAYVQPTCLLTKPVPEARDQLVVLGWGAVDLGGDGSSKLLKAEGLEVVGKPECSKSYENARTKIPRGLDKGMICVRDPNVTRSADTCWGDSGGPLLVRLPEFAPLVGVTSFGQACGSRVPGVYASVYEHLGWIEDQVWPI